MENENPTLENAVESAVEAMPPAVEATPVEEAKPENPPVEEAQAEGPSQAEIEKALNVYQMLNDPENGPAVVKMLAERMGLFKAPEAPTPPVKNEPLKATDFLAKALGEEYAFLAPKLGEGIEAFVQSQIQPLMEGFQRTQVQNEYEKAVSELNTDTKGKYSQVENKIVELMDIMKPAPGVPIKKYLSSLYQIASGGPEPAPSNKVGKVVERMVRNAQEALPPPSAATENRMVKGPALPSLDDAIAAALRNERFE